MSKPTKFTPGNKGDIYTDAETGIKYECLGRLGFCDTSFRDEPVEYNWVEAHASKYGGANKPCVIKVTSSESNTTGINIDGTEYPAWNYTSNFVNGSYNQLGELIDMFTDDVCRNVLITYEDTKRYYVPISFLCMPDGEYGYVEFKVIDDAGAVLSLLLCRTVWD